MNNTWLGAIIALVIIAAGGYYFLNREADSEDINNEEATIEENKSRKLTMADLFVLGEDFECDFSHDDGLNKSSGTAYLAEGGERIRVDFNVESSAAGPLSGHIIRDGGFNYLWSSAMAEGIKVAVTEENRQDLFAGNDQNSVPEGTEFDCVSWIENPAMFQIPEDVEFMDMAAMMQMGGVR